MSNYPEIIKHLKIYGKREDYCGWPSAAVTDSGEIVVVFCKTEEHISPSGAILSVTSSDNGETWSAPTTIRDSVIDDRESGLTVLNGGKELMVHMWSSFQTPSIYENLDEFSYRPEVLSRWIKDVSMLEYREAESLQGSSTAATSDGGRTWSEPVPGPDSIHGGVQMQDGSILIASYRTKHPKVGIYRGSGTPFTWQLRSEIEGSPLQASRFGEPHIALLPSGRVIVMLRSTAVPYDDSSRRNLLWLTYSDDQGKTWVEPYPTPLWGFPPHLLVLSDGRVLCTYGYRRSPFGERACISDDGVTWRAENEIIIRDDAENVDIGYPASVEVQPGKILSVYYQPIVEDAPATMDPPDPLRSKPDIWASIWDIPTAL
ncbi:MAG: exo-alpha-sialidase [Spirochaetales bacterium]|jgi:sialidase-1|nr:exo-alpha-sialidase [Spirochaetales bacterium]